MADKLAIGIDIGGSKIAAGVVDEDGRVLARHRADTPSTDPAAVPPGARYSVCTVEAMPRETDAAFVAIDEIQLADDLERGHIFTDRILHLRGREETLLLGSQTMAGILQKLLRGVSVVTRPRMSTLVYAGSKKITRLPRRSAIVAFSADEVYAIAELIRRQRGGAAVVTGALSPAHPQCSGRALSIGRHRFPGRHRRDRHGPEPRCRPCRLRAASQVRRIPVSRSYGCANSDRSPGVPGVTCATARSA